MRGEGRSGPGARAEEFVFAFPPMLLLALLLLLIAPPVAEGQQTTRRGRTPRDTTPTLGLEGGRVQFDAPTFQLELVKASQTVAGLRPKGSDGSTGPEAFDFTPSDRLERRQSNGYFHLGDITLRLRVNGEEGWAAYSTARDRHPVTPLPASGPALAGADLAPTLPQDFPLEIRRFWEVIDKELSLRFELENPGSEAVEIGALGIPLIFNNILQGRDLEEAHARCSFSDPYIGMGGGYVQVTRLTGHGPTLLVVPRPGTPFEAYNPLLSDPTRRGVTFEGFYEWVAHSQALAEEEWAEAEPWNRPSSVTLGPGEVRSFGVNFLLADEPSTIESTLTEASRPVAVGIPGYVLPMDQPGKLFLNAPEAVTSVRVEPAGALTLTPAPNPPDGWLTWDVRGEEWGRARVTLAYADGSTQTVHYKVTKPATEVVSDLGRFLTTEQWFEDPDDPFGRSPGVITYDYEERRQVTEDNRAWVAGMGDEGGSGSWLAAVMKQLVQPDREELAKLEQFVDEVVWGGLQYAEGERAFGVRKSLFYYEPDSMPEGTYSEDVRYGGWSSWDIEEAMSVGRSYDYPHVAALHWVFYRLARNHTGLVTNHSWEWYLERAQETGLAMVRHAPHYSQFGQMEGTIFLMILKDLQREGWTERAGALEEVMRERAELWRSLPFPFGSEMPWDSTGQEEVYAWSDYFGFRDKALVTLNAILGYMPTVPHWGYNGSARRYWDFQYAGRLRRVERQLHHYGSALNAIPVLTEFRRDPEQLYLLRVGYGGLMGALANVTQEGFGPSGFHAYPSTLRIDGISGDYGPGFLGHAVNTGAYLAHDPELGLLAFGGEAEAITVGDEAAVRFRPLDSSRARIFLAPLGLWLTLDAGTFDRVEMVGDQVRIHLSPATEHTPRALLRIATPPYEEVSFLPAETLERERGAYVVPLGPGGAQVELRMRTP